MHITPREEHLDAAQALMDFEQPLSPLERDISRQGYRLFEVFRRESASLRRRAAQCRKIFLLEDPEQDPPGTPEYAKAPQLHTLKSTVVACVADQLDNMPEAVLLPERTDLMAVAEDLTDMVRYVLRQNHFEQLHHDRLMDFFQTGTSVTQIAWDQDMAEGQGDVALLRWPIENFYWDPAAEDIQQGRAVFKASFHPMSFFAQRYGDAARYVRSDRYMDEERLRQEHMTRRLDDEEDVLLLEYWYRRYDPELRRWRVHMAQLAGGALLYASEPDYPEGLYAHGRYPFVLDAYTRLEGTPVGNGMVWEFANMQRYVNRYARYIDESVRMSAKARLLVNNAAGLDEDALCDWSRNIICGDNISESALRWFQSQPLSGQVNAQLAAFQEQIKMDSGQNQFARGEAGMGVTAASAITALQEAGGKTSRLHTTVLNNGFARMVEQVLWLIAEFYEEERERLITGRQGGMRAFSMSGRRMLGGAIREICAPPYVVEVQVQRRNPMRVQANNEAVMQLAQMAAQGGEQIPTARIVEMMQMDGKDRMLPILRELEQRHDFTKQEETLA